MIFAIQARQRYILKNSHDLYIPLTKVWLSIEEALDKNRNFCRVSWLSLDLKEKYERFMNLLREYGYEVENSEPDLTIKW